MNTTSIANCRTIVVLNPEKFRTDFFDWITDNYHVFEYFEQSAIKVWNSGFRHYSARTIIEVMRHRSNIREIGDGTWKLNDKRTPDISLLFTLLHPETSGMFELRRRTANGR